MSADEYMRAVLALAELPSGLAVALGAVGQQFHEVRRTKLPVDSQLVDVGRALLSRIRFNDINHHTEFHLVAIVGGA